MTECRLHMQVYKDRLEKKWNSGQGKILQGLVGHMEFLTDSIDEESLEDKCYQL